MKLFNTAPRLLIGLSLSLSILLPFSAAWAEVLKLGHIAPPSHSWHKIAEKLASDLETASGGKTKMAISPLAKLGQEPQMINLMQGGALQFGLFTAAGLANRDEAFYGWFLPYTFRDVQHATQATALPAAQEMLKRLEKHGMVGLGYVFAGQRHTLGTKPIKTPADLKGKKVRAFPSPIFSDFWQAVGAAPTALPLSEVAPSLITGLLDAVDIDLDALISLKLGQQAPYLTMTNHMAWPGVIAVSKKYWDGLAEADRAVMIKVIKDVEKWGFELAVKTDAENLVKTKAEKITIVQADLKAFQDTSVTVRDSYLKKDPLIGQFHRQVAGK